MVVPSKGTRRKRGRADNTDTFTLLAVAAIAAAIVIVLAVKLLPRSGRVQIESDPPAAVGLALQEGTSGAMHLSAKDMLATKRPFLIYGTAWKEDATADLVFQAVHAGFRFIDTACQPKHYNERGVGEGWKMAAGQLGLIREDVFLQTKFTSVSGQDPENMPYDAEASLEDQPKLHDTLKLWAILEGFVGEGKIRQLGISNCYDPKKFRQIYDNVTIKPKVLQNRFHDKKGFDTIGIARMEGMARQKGLTPQTLMYAFMMTLGHTPLSGTKNAGHMQDDVDLMLRFQQGEKILNDDEMETLSSLLGIR
ncbi:hypothetical protein ACHAXT_000403 [Thalassiosira profunda]